MKRDRNKWVSRIPRGGHTMRVKRRQKELFFFLILWSSVDFWASLLFSLSVGTASAPSQESRLKQPMWRWENDQRNLKCQTNLSPDIQKHKFLHHKRCFQTAVNFVVNASEGMSLNGSGWTWGSQDALAVHKTFAANNRKRCFWPHCDSALG